MRDCRRSRPPAFAARMDAISGSRSRSGSAFGLAYQVARGIADRDPTRAFANALRVIDFEQRRRAL